MNSFVIRPWILLAGLLGLLGLLIFVVRGALTPPPPKGETQRSLRAPGTEGGGREPLRDNVLVSVHHVLGNCPLENVTLSFEGPGLSEDSASGVTGSDGSYALTLPAGSYHAKAVWESRFHSEPKAFSVSPGSLTEVRIVIVTLPLVKITGRVLAEDRTGVSEARVLLTYDFDKKPPEGVDEALDGEGSIAVNSGTSGEYHIERPLYPWTYELYAKSRIHDAVRDPPKTFHIPEDQPVVSLRIDIPVVTRPYTDLTGRVVGPDGVPMKGILVVARKVLFNARGQRIGFSESVHPTDDDGIYRVRTVQDRVVLMTSHASLGSKPLEVDAQIPAHAGQEQRLRDVRMEPKSGAVEVKVVLEGSGEPVAARVVVHELEGGTSNVVSFGNTSFALDSDPAGRIRFRADPELRYQLEVAAYSVSRVEGSASPNRAKGLYTFPQTGGQVTVYVQRK